MKKIKEILMDPKSMAHKIYEDFDFKEPKEVDLELIANSEFIIVEEAVLEDIDGIIIYNKYGGLIKVNDKIKDVGWRRFTVAHELGHYFYAKENYDLSSELQCRSSELYVVDKKEEMIANEFAANLLMPENFYLDFMKYREPTIENFNKVSGEFCVSLPAAAVRYTKLGSEPIAVIFSEDGKVKWKFESEEFPFKYIRNNSDVPYKSAANSLLNLSKEFETNEIKCNVWYYADSKAKKSNVILKEESMRIDGKSAILTILRLV